MKINKRVNPTFQGFHRNAEVKRFILSDIFSACKEIEISVLNLIKLSTYVNFFFLQFQKKVINILDKLGVI